jgi:phosphoribosylpyrophosphate synthetase
MAVFCEAFLDRENFEKIVTLGDYLPVRKVLDAHGVLRVVREGGTTGYSAREIIDLEAAKKHTRRIDALSKDRKWPQKSFAAQLQKMLAENIAIVIVPSHDPFRTDPPIRQLAQMLTLNSPTRLDATMCLVRHTKIRRITYGGPSFVHLHQETICVEHGELLQDRSVLLLDDIAKSGASLKACRRLLLDHGAAEVQMLALGRAS